ncbi:MULTISPECIES: hypothetical protein [unclassified Roseateles]|uniref:hypothetical protein n=1 Tax=Pelomonas sp. Root1237 TaxID=1736434 RepID=UPI000A9D1DF3|nr:hypothetical protein [Pelomonas sp. Root1237]
MNPASISALANRELSAKARFGHVALLLAALAMSVVVGSLWLTEPALPPRTVIAFAAMTGIGLCWVVYAVWVLASRRVLLAFQQVVAARMAVGFSAVALAGALALGMGEGIAAAWPAAAVFAVMLVIAVITLVRARGKHRQLTQRRAELERQLGS